MKIFAPLITACLIGLALIGGCTTSLENGNSYLQALASIEAVIVGTLIAALDD
jgi:hypothetical protein